MTQILDIAELCEFIQELQPYSYYNKADPRSYVSRYKIKEPIIDWIRENFDDDDWDFAKYSAGLLFHNDEDAMAFKLAWVE